MSIQKFMKTLTISALFIFMMTLLSITIFSCGKKDTFSVDIDKFCDELEEQMDLSDFYRCSPEVIMTSYGVDADEFLQIVVMHNLYPTSAGEIFICETSDKTQKDEIVKTLKEHRAYKLKEMENYTNNPYWQEECANIERSEVIEKDSFVIFIIHNDSAAILDLLTEQGSTK